MMSSPEEWELGLSEGSEHSFEEDYEVKCYCGLPAKLRVSHTPENPFRLFYNCQKYYSSQCKFFRWYDEPALTGELNLIRSECTRLQESLDETEQQHLNQRRVWQRERSELMAELSRVENEHDELVAELSRVQNELDEIKRRINTVNESDLMPPIDRLVIAEDDGDDEVVIHPI